MKKLIILLAILSLPACGTITRGTTEGFKITSEPSNAVAKFSTGETCTTPCVLEKKRKHAFNVVVSKEGYKDSHSSVISQISGAGAASMAGNLIFGGVIGAGVDVVTGASMELVPNPLHVVLDKEETK